MDLKKIVGFDDIWTFHRRDAEARLKDSNNIDFLFIDALHTEKFHKWCLDTLIEPIRKSGKKVPVVVHDVFVNTTSFHKTCKVFEQYLLDKKISWTSVSDAFKPEYGNVLGLRRELNIGTEGNYTNSTKNPSIFFILNKD